MAVQELEHLAKNSKTVREARFWQKSKYWVLGLVVVTLVIQGVRDIIELRRGC